MAKLDKKGQNDVIAVKEICIWFFFVAFLLKNKKYIVYRRESGNWNRDKRDLVLLLKMWKIRAI